jgi:hypothetical protein
MNSCTRSPATFEDQKIGMYDEIYCNAELPDTAAPAGTWFQTKAFPHPTLARYRITNEGRLIDSVGRDLEADGYVIFYTDEYSDPDSPLLIYRARFVHGHLQSIVRGDKEGADWSKYDLASFRWFASTAVPESGAESLTKVLSQTEEDMASRVLGDIHTQVQVALTQINVILSEIRASERALADGTSRAQVVAETRAWLDAHPAEAQLIAELFAPQADA